MDPGRNGSLAGSRIDVGRAVLFSTKGRSLHLAERTSDALEAMREAEALVEKSEQRWWSAELHRLRGVFLTSLGAEEAQIDGAFCEAHQHREGTKVDFLDEARGSHLRGIPAKKRKSEWVRRTWISTTPLLTYLRHWQNRCRLSSACYLTSTFPSVAGRRAWRHVSSRGHAHIPD